MKIAELLITFLLISTILVLIFRNVRLYYKNIELVTKILQLEIDKNLLQDALGNNDSNLTEDSEGFIKFISESREEAYRYIEESQKVLNEFISYFTKNVEFLKGNTPKDIKYKLVIKGIEKYIEKIKNLLPKDK